MGADFETFFSAVVSGAAGLYVGMLVNNVGINTMLIITPGQTVSINGDRALPQAPSWGSGGFTVQERGSVLLTYVTLEAVARLLVTGGGALRLVDCIVPSEVLSGVVTQLSGEGSTLQLSAVTVPERPDVGERTGTMTVGADGSTVVDPPNFVNFGGPYFTVTSGPCVAYGGCVGRPDGYLPNESCEIVVGDIGGVLGTCPMFDVYQQDGLTVPERSLPNPPDCLDQLHSGLQCPVESCQQRPPGAESGALTNYNCGYPQNYFHNSDCPTGAVLTPGDTLSWETNGQHQGNFGTFAGIAASNGCEEKSMCGLPYSQHDLGGGWQVCFAAEVGSPPPPTVAPPPPGGQDVGCVDDDVFVQQAFGNDGVTCAAAAATGLCPTLEMSGIADRCCISCSDGTTGSFRVDSGPCELLQGGSCVGRPSGYGNSESCSIAVTASSTLGACPVFTTETGYDFLNIGGVNYHGTSCPTGASVLSGSTISWRSDGSVAGDGWEICAAGGNGR